MMEVLSRFDAYMLRAQLAPTIIAGAPALAAFVLLIPWHGVTLSSTIAVVVGLALVCAVMDYAQLCGDRLDARIFAAHGGKTATLRHRDHTVDAKTKAAYHAFFAKVLEVPAPTADDESADPAAADAYYERGRAWLRGHTRDTKTFKILFNANVTYGFRRNLLALKGQALVLSGLVALVCGGLLWQHAPATGDDDFTLRVFLVLGIAAGQAVYMLFAVKASNVVDASERYGHELLLTIDTLDK